MCPANCKVIRTADLAKRMVISRKGTPGKSKIYFCSRFISCSGITRVFVCGARAYLLDFCSNDWMEIIIGVRFAYKRPCDWGSIDPIWILIKARTIAYLCYKPLLALKDGDF